MRTLRSPRSVLTMLVSISLVVLLAVQLRVERDSAARRVGINVKQTDKGLQVETVVPGWPAAVAGIRDGDFLLQVDGTAVGNVEGYDGIADRFDPSRAVGYRVRRGEKTLAFAVQPGAPFAWGDYLLGGITAVCFLGVGLLALLQRSEDLRARLLFLFSTAVAFELLTAA